ncbi:MAG TPA: D-aminoacylase [Blastocatellia bacterium]|nr:D-aminoacylase [Blastocatellia bacterium]
MRKLYLLAVILLFALQLSSGIEAQQSSGEFDVLIKNGTVYDGTGSKPRRADVLIRGDKIIAVGDFKNASAKTVVDARGMAVAPGFINMLSHSYNSLLTDARSLGELRQGVTTQIFGEGSSMGPLTEEMKKRRGVTAWTTLAEYLSYAEKKGISQNVASYIGATTIREYVIGLEDKKATPEQMKQMRELVRQEMEAGALGIGSSLIYAPAFYATTEELIEMCKVASQYKGKYISHMRSEGNQLIEAVEELLRISREANIPAEIYHLKASGEANWAKMDQVIKMVEKARRQGLKVTADMYTYTAGSTGLNSTLPPWTLDGGFEALFKRLQDAETRKKIAAEVRTPTDKWENMYQLAGSPERILLVGFRNPALKQYLGKNIAEVAKLRGKDPVETIMDLILEDRSRVDTVYFMMSEENVKKQLKLPWVSFGSDAASMAAEGVFLNSSTHPRAYGNFARLLGKYVRDEKVIPMEEAIRRLAALPAANLGLDRRGLLKADYFADVVIFDPKTIADRATFEQPHQYSVGMQHVFVNGKQILKDGEHTGITSGRALWGPGKVK